MLGPPGGRPLRSGMSRGQTTGRPRLPRAEGAPDVFPGHCGVRKGTTAWLLGPQSSHRRSLEGRCLIHAGLNWILKWTQRNWDEGRVLSLKCQEMRLAQSPLAKQQTDQRDWRGWPTGAQWGGQAGGGLGPQGSVSSTQMGSGVDPLCDHSHFLCHLRGGSRNLDRSF